MLVKYFMFPVYLQTKEIATPVMRSKKRMLR